MTRTLRRRYGPGGRARRFATVAMLGIVALVAAVPALAVNEPRLEPPTSPADGSRVRTSNAAVLTAKYDRDLEASSTFSLADKDGTPVSGSSALSGPMSATGGKRWISFTPTEGLTEEASDYEATVTAVAVPAAAGGSTTTTFTFTIDNTPPETPVIVSPAEEELTNANPVQITGTAEPGSTVTVRDASTVVTATADGDGDWSTSAAFASGPHTITATATDEAGNTSVVSSRSFTVDTEAPVAPTIATPAAGNTTTSNTSVLVSGAHPENIEIRVYDNGVFAGSTSAAASAWSIPLNDRPEGSHTFTAKARDNAGNESPFSTNSGTVTIDTTDPVQPTVSVSPSPINKAGETNVTVSGTAEASSNITVSIDDAGNDATEPVTYTTTAPSPPPNLQTYSAPGRNVSSLDDGVLTVTVTSKDAANNESSNAILVGKDTVVNSPTVTISPDPITSNNQTTVTVSGTGEPGATANIQVTSSGGAPSITATTAVNNAGSYTHSFNASSLLDGTITATVNLTDTFGNTTGSAGQGAAGQDAALKDATPPGAPSITNPASNEVTGLTVTVSGVAGTAEANATVEIFEGDEIRGSATADGSGAWSTPITVTGDGPHTIRARQRDSYDNQGTAFSADRTFIADSGPPSVESVDPPEGGSPVSVTEVSATYDEPLSSGTLQVRSAAPSNTLVDGSTTIDGDTITFTPAGGSLPSGGSSYTATTTGIDLAEGPSSVPFSWTFTVDALAPTPPVIQSPAQDEVVRSKVIIAGTAKVGTTVQVYEGDAPISDPTPVEDDPDGDGLSTWSVNHTFANGPHTITATATDAALHESAHSTERRFTVARPNPAPPVITQPAPEPPVTTNPVTVRGTAETGTRVRVYEGGAEITDPDVPVIAEGGNWLVEITFAEGDHTITATATDPAGNTSDPSAPRTFTVDTIKPAPPVIETPAQDAVVGTPTTISGTAEPGAAIKIREVIDGEDPVIAATSANNAGQWTVNHTFADGFHTITATATDGALLESDPSAERTFRVDAAKPAPPTITQPAPEPPVTTNPVTVSGTAEALTTVRVYEGGAEIGTATATGSGNWSVQITFAEGDHTITATATDAANNTSDPSAPRTFTVDTIKPAPPVIETPAQDAALKNPTVTISGTAEVGATIAISEGGQVITATTAQENDPDGDGLSTWSAQHTFADGPHTITATATDDALLKSDPSPGRRFTIDRIPPAPPTIVSPAQSAVTGPSVTVSGSAEAKSFVQVRRGSAPGGVPIGNVTQASETGSWSVTITFPGGSNTINATATDAAGNESPASQDRSFTVDATPPAAPVITTPAGGSVVRSPVVVSGTAEASSTVTVREEGVVLGTVTASSGVWSMTKAFSDGPHTISATAKDSFGNESAPSSRTFTADSTPPPVPAITSPADGAFFTSTSVTIAGTGEAGSVVTVRDSGTLVDTATVDSSGDWSMTKTMGSGPHTINATAKDAVGNESAPSPDRTFTVDSTPPSVPVITTPAADQITPNTSVTLGGTASADTTTVLVLDNGVQVATATPSSGSWSVTFSDLSNGSHPFTAKARDEAGNVSAASNTRTITVDTVPPAVPTISSPAQGAKLNACSVTISGFADLDSEVTVREGGSILGTVTADAAGRWSLTYCFTDGPHAVNATAKDAAGNQSTPSSNRSFTVDTVAPNAPTIISPAPGATLSNATVTITGTAEGGAIVTVKENGATIAVTSADGAGAWTMERTFTNGSHTVKATAKDDAGNESAEATRTFTVDASKPSPPVITTPAEGATVGSPVTISGSAEADSIVTVSEGTTLISEATAGPTGAWSMSKTMTDGLHMIKATARDAAGNVSDASADRSFTVDGTAPVAPVITKPEQSAIVITSLVKIEGTAEAGSTVTVREGGTPLGTAIAGEDGTWMLTVTMADGPHTVTATAADAVGNQSTPSPARSFTVTPDRTAPPAPVITSPAEGSVHPAAVTVSGTAEAGATVEVTESGAALGTATAGADGTWSMDLTFASGAHAIRATATDPVGNESLESAVRNFTVDASAPSATIATPNNTQFGPTTPVTITGTASDNRTVQSVAVVFTDAAGNPTTVPATYDPTAGTWSATASTLLPGQYTVVARATDGVGNVGTSPSITITVLRPPSVVPVPTTLPSL